MSEQKKKTYINAFNAYKGQNGVYLQPNFSKYGVKGIKLELHDGSTIDVQGNNILFVNEVADERKKKMVAGIGRLVENGTLSEEDGHKRVNKVNKLSHDVTLVLDNK